MNEDLVIDSNVLSEKKKKVRKWDNPNPISKACEDDFSIGNNLNVDAGKERKLGDDNKSMFLKASSISEFGFDYDINDLEPIYRSIICLGITLDEIKQNTGATVMVKGKYLTTEEKEISKERPLYLHIKGPSQQIVNAAIAKIKSLVTKTLNPTNASTDQIHDINKQQLFVQDKVFVGLDRALPGFNLNQRILGPQGSYLQHIQISTGAKVSLRGRGSGFVESITNQDSNEPLHLLIQHATTFGIHQAKCLSSNLIQTIQREYVKYEKDQALLPPTITAGTASMLAGLQQFHNQGIPPFNPQFQNPFQSQLPQFNSILQTQNTIGTNPITQIPTASLQNNFGQFTANPGQFNLGQFNGNQGCNIDNAAVRYNGDYNAGFQYASSGACPVSAPTFLPPVGASTSSSTFNLSVLPIGPPISKGQDPVTVAPVGPPCSKSVEGVAPANILSASVSSFDTSSALPVFRLTSFLPKILPEIKKIDTLDISRNKDGDDKSIDVKASSSSINSQKFDPAMSFFLINDQTDNILGCTGNNDQVELNSLKQDPINLSDSVVNSNFKNRESSSSLGTPLSSLELPPLEFFANVPPPILLVEKKRPDANAYYSNFIHPAASASEANKYEKNEKIKKSKKRKFVENKEVDDVQEIKDGPSFVHPTLQNSQIVGQSSILKKAQPRMDIKISSKTSSRLAVPVNDRSFDDRNSVPTTNLYTNDCELVNDANGTNKSAKVDDERMLMPPPSLVVLPIQKSKNDPSTEKKKLKGALSSVAALYGSDDED